MEILLLGTPAGLSASKKPVFIPLALCYYVSCGLKCKIHYWKTSMLLLLSQCTSPHALQQGCLYADGDDGNCMSLGSAVALVRLLVLLFPRTISPEPARAHVGVITI